MKISQRLATLLVATVWISGAEAQTQSYPLICMGGENTTMKVVSNASGTGVYFRFRRSDSAGRDGARHGTCAWMDRRLNSDEPTELYMHFPDVITEVTAIYRGIDNNKLHFELKGGGRRDHREFLTRLFAAYRLAYEFRVEAYTDHSNNILRATKFVN